MYEENVVLQFAYLYFGGHNVCFFVAIKYTVNHFNLVSEAICIINTVSARGANTKVPDMYGVGGVFSGPKTQK